MNNSNLTKLVSYVESHGFRAEINDQDQNISIYIPMAHNGQFIGYEETKACNFEETRIALGY